MMTGEIISLPDIDVSSIPLSALRYETYGRICGLILSSLYGMFTNQPSLLKIQETKSAKTPLPSSKLVFGKTFTDHMLMIPWTSEAGWAEPVIKECEYL
jgi:hypothetical protein